MQQNTGGGQGLSGEGGLGTGGNPFILGIRDSQLFRLESWAHRCDLVGGGGPQHPGGRREKWKGHGVVGHHQTTLRISLVSLSLCYLWFALLLLISRSPVGNLANVEDWQRKGLRMTKSIPNTYIYQEDPRMPNIRPRGPLWGPPGSTGTGGHQASGASFRKG